MGGRFLLQTIQTLTVNQQVEDFSGFQINKYKIKKARQGHIDEQLEQIIQVPFQFSNLYFPTIPATTWYL